jgi:GNAT superfamily N-acetyltransferase
MFTEFYVHPLRRGMGWGTKLLDSMCAWADRRGWDLITYPRAYGNGARPNNEMLRSLYCGWGFRTLPSNPTYMVRRCR